MQLDSRIEVNCCGDELFSRDARKTPAYELCDGRRAGGENCCKAVFGVGYRFNDLTRYR
jgi:hypothetical protein